MQKIQSHWSFKCFMLFVFAVSLVLLNSGCNYILPNKPPYVEKISPKDSSVFNVGDIVVFEVNAYDVDGSVRHVIFTPGGLAPHTDSTAPYKFSWATSGLHVGDYVVDIMAIDNRDEPYIISVPVRLIGMVTPYAGKDTTYTDSRTSCVLDADIPQNSIGTWTIIAGLGGAISDIHNPKATLSGLPCQSYTLRWTISDGTRELSDEVTIRFSYQPSRAIAGPDQIITDGRTSAMLQAATPADGSGRWAITAGSSGVLSDPTLPNSAFTGLTCITYKLVWTVSTPCASSSDTVEIRFDPNLINPNAGPDQIYTDGRTSATMAANGPSAGNGTWTIISGQGGYFSGMSDPRAIFTGQLCQTYILRWTLSSPCSSKSDDMTVSFSDIPSVADAGPDVNLSDGSIYAQLNATPPLNGIGQWSIVSGGSGSFSNPGDSHAVFAGIICHSYVLKWTVSTACSSSSDEVTVVLNQVAVNAYAGPDIRISDGSVTTNLQGNTPGIGVTGTWTIISGQGGLISEINNPGTLFTGVSGQIYTLKWSFTSACMENSDQVTIAFNTNVPMTDVRDGKTYQTVKIGNQVWMAENLNYATTDSYAYDGSSDNASTYGRLYDWSHASSSCPSGWHLPTDLEWRQLEVYLGMDATTSMLEWYRGLDEGGMLKEAGTLFWESPNAGATNISGFSARPGGYRSPTGIFGGISTHAGFWPATGNATGKAIYRTLHKDKSQVGRDWYEKGYGFSIRCVKN